MHLSFTLSTIPMLVLGLYLWCRAKGQLMPVAMFMSVFQAASVMNVGIGSFQIGVQPTYLALLAALVTKIGGRRPSFATWRPAPITTLLLALFVAYSCLSALVFPLLFRGVPISNPKFGENIPLKWEVGHLNQLFYLLLSFVFYLIAAYWTTPAELTKSLRWLVGGAVLAALIGLYQFASLKTGLPFPSQFLHTSPTYAIFEGYEINGFPRMNSTFSEAAAAALSLNVALAAALWRLLMRPDSLRNLLYVAAIGVGLLLTISTTGYICLIFLLVVAISRYAAPWRADSDSRQARTLLVIPACLAVLSLLGISSVRESFARLTHTVLLDKTNTSSYKTRTAWNVAALNTAVETNGLGAGWGVCRASSFIPTLLGNCGIPGLVLFLAFCWRLFRPVLKINSPLEQTHGAVLFALGAVLLDLVVSAPEVANPMIWLLFAMAAKLAAGRFARPAFSARAYSAPQRQFEPVVS